MTDVQRPGTETSPEQSADPEDTVARMQDRFDLIRAQETHPIEHHQERPDPWALLDSTMAALQTLARLQSEDRQARLQAVADLDDLKRTHTLLQSEHESQRQALAAERDTNALQDAAVEAAHHDRIDELERELESRSRELDGIRQHHASLALKQHTLAGTYLSQIESLQSRIANEQLQLEEKRQRFSSALRRHFRFARHVTHPLVNEALLVAAGANSSTETKMDSSLFTRTNYQPQFSPNPQGEYRLSDFVALHDRNFVRAAYLAVLRREPDQEGAESYLTQVRAGEHKAKLLDKFLKSDEGRQHHTVISGLAEHLRITRLCEFPVVGRALAAVFFLANINAHLRDLRVLENHVIRIAEESQAVHEANMSKLRSITK